MRATIMYRAGDVRVENVPDATLNEPTDALVRITRACICGSDLLPYKELLPGDYGRASGRGLGARPSWHCGLPPLVPTNEARVASFIVGGQRREAAELFEWSCIL